MKFLLILSAFLASTIMTFGHDKVPGAPQNQPIALKNAKVYTITQGTIEGATIVFDRGKIIAVGKNVDIPSNAEVIDCTGKSIYPGFIAAESTLGLIEIEAVRSTRDNIESGQYNPNAKASTAYNPDSEVIPTIRHNGVLIAHIVPEGGSISGKSAIMQLDGWTKEDISLQQSYALIVNIPYLGVNSAPWISKTADEQIKEAENNLRELKDYIAKAKMYSIAARNGLAENAQDIRMEAMRPIFEKQMPVMFSATKKEQILAALEIIAEYKLNGIISGASEAHLCLEELQLSRIPIILPRTHSLPRNDDAGFDEPFTLPSILESAGINWAFTESSFWQQRNLPFNAGTSIAYGLSEEAALRGLTINPASILGISSRVGSLDIGKDATLFVSSGNALDALTNHVEHAYIQGKKVDLENRHTDLAKKYRMRYQQMK